MNSRNVARACRGLLFGLVLTASAAAQPAFAGDIVGIAFVQPDGSLYLQGRTIRLYGIYIPPGEYDCVSKLVPARCGNRPALALERAIDGFVRCRPVGRYADSSWSAVCYVGSNRFTAGRDLAASLISNGWALAGPGAPFEYVALERIAMAQRRGVWQRADVVTRYFYD
jgi:endonuclease YncB( thermonuclease family)